MKYPRLRGPHVVPVLRILFFYPLREVKYRYFLYFVSATFVLLSRVGTSTSTSITSRRRARRAVAGHPPLHHAGGSPRHGGFCVRDRSHPCGDREWSAFCTSPDDCGTGVRLSLASLVYSQLSDPTSR